MRHDEARLWHESAELHRERIDGLYAIVKHVHLPTTLKLFHDCITNECIAVLAHFCDDRKAPWGWCRNGRNVSELM